MALSALVAEFGYAKSTIYNIIKDCDDSKVKKASPSRKVAIPIESFVRPDLSTGNLGEAARQMIAARLMMAGLQVFMPLAEDTSVDLLVLKGREALRCQCKCLYIDKKVGSHILKCSGAGRQGTRGIKKHIYGAEEVDFFIGYCLDTGELYIVPMEATGGRSELRLWILRECAANNQHGVFESEKYREAYHLLGQ